MNIDQVLITLMVIALSAVALVIFVRIQQEEKRRRQVELERDQREEKKQRRATLKNELAQWGQILFSALSRAAGKNVVSNILPSGEMSSTTQKLKVSAEMGDTGIFSIFLQMPDFSCHVLENGVHGYSVAQVHICLSQIGKEILFNSTTEPNRFYSIAEFSHVVEELSNYVENYCFFLEEEPVTSV